MEKMMGKVRIRLIHGDITEQDAEAIVNAANNHFWMGAGVAGAIKIKGGAKIEEEAMSKGPVPVGQTVVTKAGELKAKYIIHAAVMGQDLITSEDYIRDATINSLKKADELKIKSIAFPAFGTGVGGYPTDQCASIMIDVVKGFSERLQFIEEIRFVLFNKQSFDVWSAQL
jgi:O-acetyl-ADP-ribose deacetylase (regulator of RNase III)